MSTNLSDANTFVVKQTRPHDTLQKINAGRRVWVDIQCCLSLDKPCRFLTCGLDILKEEVMLRWQDLLERGTPHTAAEMKNSLYLPSNALPYRRRCGQA